MVSDPYQTPAEVSESPGPPPAFGRGETSPASMAWWVIRTYAGLLLVCYLLVWIPVDLLTSYFDQHVIDPDDIGTSFRVQQSADFWFGIIAEGAIIATAIAALSHPRPTLGDSFGLSFRRYWNLWTTRFCVGLITVLGLLLLIIPGIYFLVRAIYADTVAVAEGAHGPTAIRRSFELTKGRFGETLLIGLKILGVYVLVGFVGFVIYLPAVIFLEESDWLWVLEALFAQLLAIAVIYAHVLLYCWYREVDLPITSGDADATTAARARN